MNYKIGTACNTGEIVNGKFKNFPNTTIGTVRECDMLKLSPSQQYDKVKSKVDQNLTALFNQLHYISTQAPIKHMYRISSNLLPMFDHPEFGDVYDKTLLSTVNNRLSIIGNLARDAGIRLSMHPDQFNVLNSDRAIVVDKALNNLRMHEYIIDQLGYHDDPETCINLHLNGKTDNLPANELSSVKHLLSFENDEKTGNTDRVLSICNQHGFKMVLDIHHHFCNTGKCLDPACDTVSRVFDTWQGVRPKIHLSQPYSVTGNKRDMCKHSDTIEDSSLICHASQYLTRADIMIEAKHKNVAVNHFVNQI